MYGRQTETAVAAMSRLAEVYDAGKTRLAASEIAESRNLQHPSVAKVLTVLSQAGLVEGSPGPGGGYTLARHPREIVVYEIFSLFERDDDDRNCPYGGGECGVGEGCALHDKLVAVRDAMDLLLHETNFDQFRKDEQKRQRAVRLAQDEARPRRRRSYRAAKPRRKSRNTG